MNEKTLSVVFDDQDGGVLAPLYITHMIFSRLNPKSFTNSFNIESIIFFSLTINLINTSINNNYLLLSL